MRLFKRKAEITVTMLTRKGSKTKRTTFTRDKSVKKCRYTIAIDQWNKVEVDIKL